jgi:hypothetical protein
LTVPVKPLAGVIWIAAVVDPPGEATVRLVEPDEMEIGVLELAPVPLRATLCGEPVALSVMVSVPVRVPVVVGVKVTEIVQLAPAATLVPQVLV